MRGRAAGSARDFMTLDVGSGSLVGAAARLFRKSGYAGATTRQLARALGVRSPSLYFHIGKKEDLLYEICVDCLRRLTKLVTASVDAEHRPLARVRALIRTHIRVALADTDKHVTMLVELRSLAPRRRAAVVRLRDAYERLVRRKIQQAQRAGTIRADIPSKYLALALHNLLNWSIFWYQPGRGLDPDELAEVLAKVFLEGATRRRR